MLCVFKRIRYKKNINIGASLDMGSRPSLLNVLVKCSLHKTGLFHYEMSIISPV